MSKGSRDDDRRPDGTKRAPQRGPRATRFRIGRQELAVLAFPPEHTAAMSALTHTEREILTHLLEGSSNAAIAQIRGTSVHTVANQVASILRKLGVASRSELAAAMTKG